MNVYLNKKITLNVLYYVKKKYNNIIIYLILPDRDSFPSIFYNLFPDVSIFHCCLRF